MNIEDMMAYGVGTIILLLLLYWAWPSVVVALVMYGMYELFHRWNQPNRQAHSTD